MFYHAIPILSGSFTVPAANLQRYGPRVRNDSGIWRVCRWIDALPGYAGAKPQSTVARIRGPFKIGGRTFIGGTSDH